MYLLFFQKKMYLLNWAFFFIKKMLHWAILETRAYWAFWPGLISFNIRSRSAASALSKRPPY